MSVDSFPWIHTIKYGIGRKWYLTKWLGAGKHYNTHPSTKLTPSSLPNDALGARVCPGSLGKARGGISWGCCKKVPQTGGLQTTNIYPVIILEARSLKSRIGQGRAYSKTEGMGPPLSLPASASSQQSLANGHITCLCLHCHMTFSLCICVFPWPSPSLCASSFLLFFSFF